jgi:two-component system alkaline phosphatase synthesis response regulator PhoP
MDKKKILLIDDEVDIVDLVKTRLDLGAYYVIPLYTSKRAVEVAKREKPAAILLDIMMPDKDGYEVCRELKSDQATRDIPVILFTAQSDEKKFVANSSKSAGADDYILKPFEPDELIKKLEALL